MMKLAKSVLILTVFVVSSTIACAEEHHDTPSGLNLSADLKALLQAEMRALLVASQDLVLPVVSGDWEAIAQTSEQIRDSYVMAQKLSDTQRRELEEKLPSHFKRLDREFHARAEKLYEAAVNKDAESVAFQYFRLLETCTSCHAEFASSRFAGFTPDIREDHHH